MTVEILMSISGVLIIILLGVIGYFLKQVHEIIKSLLESVNNLKVSFESIKYESKRGYDSLKIITNEHGKRLDNHSKKLEKHQDAIYELKRSG